MKIVGLYHAHGEFARQLENFARDFDHRHGKTMELIDLETKEGADIATLYDIVQYPAILAIRDDGQLAKAWLGTAFPLMDEVSGYANG